MDDGEPSGASAVQTVCTGRGVGEQGSEEDAGGSVCLWALLHEAYSHLDYGAGVAASGGEGGGEWEVWTEVQDGELGGGQVEASVRDRGGEHEGEGRSGEEGGEAGDPSPAAQGDPGSSNGAVRRAREEGEAQGWRGRGKKARVEERVGYDGCGMAEGDHWEQGGMGGSGGSGSTRERGEMGGSGGSSGEPGVNGEGGEVGGRWNGW